MSLRLLAVVLRDQDSGTVLDSSQASIRVTHKRTGRFLRDAEYVAFDPGQWHIAEDAEVPFGSGSREEVLILEVRRRGRPTTKHELSIGYDATGCHIEFRRPSRARAELRVP
ncbi:MAG: hypothetical protein MUF00_20670 [Gemmatimonadaceae bacterium]|jgi:hypothetical protein|nr:hypothetical protein [Gemmatimonadaceae bacterium]